LMPPRMKVSMPRERRITSRSVPWKLASARWRFTDNELLEPDYGKDRDLAHRRVPVSTLHRETHGEPGRSARYRLIHQTFGLGAELRFRTGDTTWGFVALMRGHHEPDFNDKEIAFAARLSRHLGHGLRDALMRQQAAAGTPARGPGVVVLGRDGSVRSLTDQASFWLEQFPPDRGTGLELPGGGARGRPVGARSRKPVPAAPPGPTRLVTYSDRPKHRAPESK
jgi:hypothetical protein